MVFEPVLQPHKVVPLFTLPDKFGESFNLAKQRGRDHWLLVIAQPNVDLAPFLQQLAPQAGGWQQIPARGIVVVADEDAAGALGSQPFTVLIDANNKVRSRFLPEGAQIGVFALDRYGSLYHQWLVADPGELPAATDVTEWLQSISMQCSI